MNANARTGQTKQMTLALDIGGSHLKAAILDESGAMSSSPVRVETPKPATPEAIVATLMHVTQRLGQFNRVSNRLSWRGENEFHFDGAQSRTKA